MSWPVQGTGVGIGSTSGAGAGYKKASRSATRQWATRQQVIANGVVGYCYHNNFTAEGKIVSMRPIHNNLHTSALTGVKFSVAPTADFSSPLTPTGAWIDGTYSSTASSTGTIVARLAAEQPSLTFGDWIEVPSIAPTDGGLYKYCLRHFVPAANTSTSEGYYPLQNFFHTSSATNGGRILQTFRQDVDGIASKAAFTSTTPYANPGLIMGWQYQLESGTIFTIAGGGDSIMEGAVNGAAGNFGNGWLWQSLMLFRQAFPGILVELANFGISSQSSSTYQNLIVERMGRAEFDALVYAPFSPNDGVPTTSTFATQAGLVPLVQSTARNGSIPVMYVGGCPNTAAGWTTPQDAIRRYGNRFHRGNFRMSRGYVDMDPDLWDGVNAFKAGVSTDGTHPNEAGAGLVAQNQGFAALRLMLLGF